MIDVAALVASSAVVTMAVAWVRPVGLSWGARPRDVAAPVGSHRLDGSGGRACPAWFASAAERSALPMPAGQAWTMAQVAILAIAALALVVGGPGLVAVATAGALAGASVGLRATRHRRDHLIARAVPDTLDAIARSTRSGLSVVQALAALDRPDASPADHLFAAVATRVGRGVSLRSGLDQLLAASDLPPVRLAVTALLVGSETGAAPARAVEGVAATLRDRMALDREAAAHSSQARASVAVLVVAPVGFGLFAIATDPRVGQFLFRTPAGWFCLAIGVGLDLVGAWWMHRIMVDAR
jgi:tight adherence protein B